MTTSTPSQSSSSYEAIKRGIDAHAKYYWVSRQVAGATPQPVQKKSLFALLLQLARAVSSRGALKGRGLKEDGFAGGSFPAARLTKEGARQELALLHSDKAFAKSYLAVEAAAVKRFTELHQIAFGGVNA